MREEEGKRNSGIEVAVEGDRVGGMPSNDGGIRCL